MAQDRKRQRRINLPPATDIHTDVLADFKKELGYPPNASVTAIRLHSTYVSVTLQPKAGVQVTVRHAVIGRELDDDA